MAAGVTIEILDLRHFAAPVLRPVLDAEGELWSKRLHWDYRASARLLMQYLDNHLLPGYAALESGQVTGYAFCVYEETKAVIGDVFALPGQSPDRDGMPDGAPEPAREIEGTLLRHLFETLLNSPNVADRITAVAASLGHALCDFSRVGIRDLSPALYGAAACRKLEPPACRPAGRT